MDYRTLGSTGMQVSPLCLGAMMFGQWGEPDHDTSAGIIHAALDAGINFVDTADIYARGESEEIVGKALKGRRDDVILATKFHGPMDINMGEEGGDPNNRGNSRRWVVREVENSLRRLQTDWIDLYQVHCPDDITSDQETLSALTDLQRAGKIRAFGSSTFPAHHMVEAQWTARERGLSRYVTEQPPYWGRPTSRSPPTCSTASTRSSPRAATSRPATRATNRRRFRTRRCVGASLVDQSLVSRVRLIELMQ